MKILYLSAWFPYPPDNGARIRAYYLMKSLAEKHDVYLISLLQDDSDPVNADKLSSVCKVVSLHRSNWFRGGSLKSFLGYFSRVPRSVVETFNLEVIRSVREAIDTINPNVIIASSLGVAAYIPHDVNIATVLDEHNCEFGILKRSVETASGCIRRFRAELTWKKAMQWEKSICRRFDAVTIVSERDKQMLLKACPSLSAVHVVPNGVDTELYSHVKYNPRPAILIYNGALTYGANLDAIRFYISEIYPILRKTIPAVKLVVTGRTSGVDLTGIADCSGIELTGYVEDIRTVLESSAACIIPLRQGGGTRLKILEAMAAGVPVVSTSIGAEGIEAVPGKHLLIADEPFEFANVVGQVLGDDSLNRNLRTAARDLVEEKYSWKKISVLFSDIIESVAYSHECR